MSLTSYRAAPPRAKMKKPPRGQTGSGFSETCEWVCTVPACYNAWRRPTLPTLER